MNTDRFLTMRLEDGEQVVRLRGGRGKGLAWKSDRPHAGVWGPEKDYVLVPCQTSASAKRRAKVAVSSWPGLNDRSSDDAVLLLGPPGLIERFMTEGPPWARALISRKGMPRSDAQQAAAERLASR